MSNTSEIWGWCSSAFRVALQTFGQACPVPDSFKWHKHPAKFELLESTLLTGSPWEALADVGFEVSPMFDNWPHIFNLSANKPAPVPPRYNGRFMVSLVACVMVYCPICRKSSPHIWDAEAKPLQTAADECQCPHCDAYIWPWLSKHGEALYSDFRPGRIQAPGMSNILYLPPTRKGD